jgi:hypothetical protein
MQHFISTAKVQVLQNKAAKLILDKPKHSSATEALQELGLDSMYRRRRLNRLILVFKGVNGLIDCNFNFCNFKDIHLYNTRHKFILSKPLSRRSWGQHCFIFRVIQ